MKPTATVHSRTLLEGWAIDDPHPGKDLHDIPSLAGRARAFWARNADQRTDGTGVMIIAGAINMIEGMEHHYRNFLREQDDILSGITAGRMPLAHETIAYLNRIGQFAAFVRSDFARPIIGNLQDAAPTISKLLIFRNKYTAHRSIDAPQDEPEHARVMHEYCMRPGLLIQRPGCGHFSVPEGVIDPVQLDRLFLETNYQAFQILDHKTGIWISFAVERDHSIVVDEAYAIMERIILFRASP